MCLDPYILDEDFEYDYETSDLATSISTLTNRGMYVGFNDIDDHLEDSEANDYFVETFLNSPIKEELANNVRLDNANNIFLDIDNETLHEIIPRGSNPSTSFQKRHKVKNFEPHISPQNMPISMLAMLWFHLSS